MGGVVGGWCLHVSFVVPGGLVLAGAEAYALLAGGGAPPASRVSFQRRLGAVPRGLCAAGLAELVLPSAGNREHVKNEFGRGRTQW